MAYNISESSRRKRAKQKLFGSDYEDEEKQTAREREALEELNKEIKSKGGNLKEVNSTATNQGCGCLICLIVLALIIYFFIK